MARAFAILVGFALVGCVPSRPSGGTSPNRPESAKQDVFPVVQDGKKFLIAKPDGLYSGLRSSTTYPRRSVPIRGTAVPIWNATERSLTWPTKEGEERVYISEDIKTSKTPVNVQPVATIEIFGDEEAAQAVAQLQEIVRQGVQDNTEVAPSPFGAVTTRFDGHVFWDADVWVFPALMFTDPNRARTISNYRLKLMSRYQRVALEWMEEGRPVWGRRLGAFEMDPGSLTLAQGIKVPWESDVYGDSRARGNSKYQDHVTMSVALGLSWAADLGLAPKPKVDQFLTQSSVFLVHRVEADAQGAYHIRNVMGPNEFHRVDNDLYTNMAARWLFRQMGDDEYAERLVIPRDAEGRLKNASNDPETTYQQVSGLLAAFPLQDPEAEREALSLIERFSPRITPNGPAMSASIEATVLARNGKADEALKRWRDSWQPYMDGPLIFREKPLTGDTPFITGAAGCLNTVIYGFCGVRLDDQAQPEAKFERRLRSGKVVSIRPNLPTGWERIVLPEFWLDGQKHRLEVTRATVTLTPLP